MPKMGLGENLALLAQGQATVPILPKPLEALLRSRIITLFLFSKVY